MFRRRPFSIVLAVASLTIVVLAGYFLTKDDNIELPALSQEIQRVTSPDLLTDAVLMTTRSEKSHDSGFAVCLVLRDQPADTAEPIFVADQTDNLQLYWVDPDHLEIGYSKANVLRFRHLWRPKSEQTIPYVVQIKLAAGAAQWPLSQNDQ